VPAHAANRQEIEMTRTIAPAGPGISDADLRLIVEYAGLAPSVHNTQPWRFVARGSTIEVHPDNSRRLDYLDPVGRQQAISCGAAIEFARLAIRALGHSCVVRLLPGGTAEIGPLATLTVGRTEPTTAEEQRLVDAIPRRRTDRSPYEDRAVPADVVRRLRDVVAARGCWARMLDRPGDRLIASRLLRVAEDIEAADPRYAMEIGSWTRTGPAPDGVPPAAVPRWSRDRVSDIPLRDFTGHARRPHPGDDEPPPRVEHDAVVLIGTDDDSPLAWLRAGCAIGLAWLLLTAENVSLQPLGPVLDVTETRARLRRDLGLLGQPQLMFRIGYGTGSLAAGRRPVGETLEVISPT
jgi:hypothetical protein